MAFQDMVDYLDSCWNVRDQIVPCLLGPVGIGKTAAVHQHAKNVGAGKVVTIIASQVLPSEVSGITMPDKDTKAMEIYDHYRLSSLEDGDILFFDELLEADQCVLKACLTLIESREMMSGRKLPNIQIVAATNPSIKQGMLADNISQRFLFKEFDVDKRDTQRYIADLTNIIVPDSMLDKLENNYSSGYNLLTPRSLTKMALWMGSAKDVKEGTQIANQIDTIWNGSVGRSLYYARFPVNEEAKIKESLKNIVKDYKDFNDFDWSRNLVDIMSDMATYDVYAQIKEKLASMDASDLIGSGNKDEILF